VPVADSNGAGLVGELVRVAAELSLPPGTVLFLTNDRQVATIAAGWHRLQDRFRLSWAQSASLVASQLDKSAHQARAEAAGCAYPDTRTIDHVAASREACVGLALPLIAKPARPLGPFKTRIIDAPGQLDALCREFPGALPLLVQPFIPGGDDRIFFCALYLRDGAILARFDGRKLRSRPMGHTTAAEPASDDRAYAVAARYFGGLGLSGPCSIEVKLDAQGEPWIIEPTVGRTDFWVDVCTANGTELPWIEYCDQAGLPLPERARAPATVWLNTERDPRALPWLLREVLLGRLPARGVTLPYARLSDPMPLLAAIGVFFRKQLTRVARVSRRALLSRNAKSIS
jgi:predicted ATP-grasp superfamily ATP-dependent carboligase